MNPTFLLAPGWHLNDSNFPPGPRLTPQRLCRPCSCNANGLHGRTQTSGHVSTTAVGWKVWLSHLNGKVSTILPDSGNQFLFSSKANLVNAIRNWAPWWVKWRWEHVVLITFYPDSFGTAAECIFWNFRSCFGNFRIFQKVWQKCEISRGRKYPTRGRKSNQAFVHDTLFRFWMPLAAVPRTWKWKVEVCSSSPATSEMWKNVCHWSTTACARFHLADSRKKRWAIQVLRHLPCALHRQVWFKQPGAGSVAWVLTWREWKAMFGRRRPCCGVPVP